MEGEVGGPRDIWEALRSPLLRYPSRVLEGSQQPTSDHSKVKIPMVTLEGSGDSV